MTTDRGAGAFVRVLVDGTPKDGMTAGGGIALLETPFRPDTATGETVPADGAHLLAPVQPTKIIGVGRNYRGHIAEMGFAVPTRPSVFLKPPSAVCGPSDPILLRRNAAEPNVWFEAEVALVVGRRARDVSEACALDHLVGYTCANDVSARDLQADGRTLAKGQDTFCPLGDAVVPFDGDAAITTRCWVNGELRQSGTSDELLFGFPEIVSFVSRYMTLLPGDVILTGSPAGSGPMFDGDTVEIVVGAAGPLVNPVRLVD